MFQSEAKQDRFVGKMLKFKRNGYFLDIGSWDAIKQNNTYFFESLDWSGICIEICSEFNDSYKKRKCNYVNADATKIDYKLLFSEKLTPNEIDFLSLDVETQSYDVLEKLPFSEYTFKIITVEHDYYLYGDTYKSKQVELLTKQGYVILCNNVYVEQSGHFGKKQAFEDWWIYPKFFDYDLVNKIKSNQLYPSEILAKFEVI